MSSESSGPIATPSPGLLRQPGSIALDNSPVVYGLGFFGRLSKLLEALALILLGLLIGYVSGEDPGPNPASAFRLLMSVLPFACMVAALLLARTLRLEEDESPVQAWLLIQCRTYFSLRNSISLEYVEKLSVVHV